MNLQVPLNAGKFLNSCTVSSFSRSAQLHKWVSEMLIALPMVLEYSYSCLLSIWLKYCWEAFLLEKVTVAELVNKFLTFYGSLLCSHGPDNNVYPKPYVRVFNLYLSILYH
jgi:hypothetical protein